MSGQLYGAVGAISVVGFGWWFSPSPVREREKDLVRILEKQLDRCGPDQLTTPAPVRIYECSVLSVVQICCFGILLGVVLTCCAGGCIYFKLRGSRQFVVEAESVGDAAVHEESTHSRVSPQQTSPRRVTAPLALEYSELARLGY